MVRKIYKKVYNFSQDDILNGQVGRTLTYFSLPLVLSNLVYIVYSFVELFWLGKLGVEALAAMAYVGPIVFFFTAIGGGVISAGGIIVAQHKGAKNEKEIDYAAAQTITFIILLSFFVLIFGVLLAKPILSLLGASPKVLSLALSYLYLAFPGMILLYGFLFIRTFFRSIGNAVAQMWISSLSYGVNMIFLPLFIWGWGPFPKLGFVGVALSLLLGRGLATFLGLFLFFKGSKGIRLRLSYLLPDFAYLKYLLRLGLPISGEIAARASGTNAVLPVISLFGTTAVASFGVGYRFLSLSYAPAIGISQAIGIMAGQSIGAKKHLRVIETAKKGVGGTFLIFSLIGLFIFLQAESLVRIFISEPEVVRMASQFLKITAFSLGFSAAIRGFIGIFRGTGNTLAALMISLFTFVLFRAPLAFFLSRFFKETGIWWAFFLTSVAGASVALFWFSKGKWQKRPISPYMQISSEAEE